MNSYEGMKSSKSIKARKITFPNHHLTWAGEFLGPDILLFGTDNGILLASHIDKPIRDFHPFQAASKHEAINSAAVIARKDEVLISVSTRAEVTSHRISLGRKSIPYKLDHGSHSVIANNDTGFIATAGLNGLVSIRQSRMKQLPDSIYRPKSSTYFYSCIILNNTNNEYYIAAACREDGVFFGKLSTTGKVEPLWTRNIPRMRLDFVGITPVSTLQFPLAFAALTRTNSITFFRDPSIRQVGTLHNKIKGIGYKLLSFNNHLIILTSKGIHLLRDIIPKALHYPFEQESNVFHYFDIDAFDITIAFNRWLLAVTPEAVIQIDLNALLMNNDAPLTQSLISSRDFSDPKNLWPQENPDKHESIPVWIDYEQEAFAPFQEA